MNTPSVNNNTKSCHCGAPRVKHRTVCAKCYSKYVSKNRKIKLLAQNNVARCEICNKHIVVYRKSQKLCKSCYVKKLKVLGSSQFKREATLNELLEL